MTKQDIGASVVYQFGLVQITDTVLTTWGIMIALAIISWFFTRNLLMTPGSIQVIVEGIVTAIEDAIKAVAPNYERKILPFIGTLWIFLVVANLCGLIPDRFSIRALVWDTNTGYKKIPAALPVTESHFVTLPYHQ